MARKKKKPTSVTVDMAGVEVGGLVPEGEHLATVKEVTLEESDNGEYLKWKCSTAKGQLYFNTSTQPQALWNLRGLLEAMGEEIPEGPLEIDFEDMVDNTFVAVVGHEEYDGKMRARVNDYMSADGAEGGVEVDGDGSDGLEKLTKEEVGEMDADELVETVEEYSLDVNFKRLKTAKKKVAAVIAALEEAGYLDEDD